jgi:GTP-binding protein EngB required for normal cell division
LNAVLGRRIARVSATPGKTRAMNVYEIPGSGEWGVGPDGSARGSGARRPEPLPTPRSLYFLDLPGYGYARASKIDRAAFAGLLRHALMRERLRGVVWLLDIRHEPSVDDRAMQDRLAAGATPVLAVLTKSDKLPRGPRAQRARALTAALALDEDQVLVTSTRTAEGIADLRDAIAGLAAGP